MASRDAAQLFVNERKQPGECRFFAVLPGSQQRRGVLRPIWNAA
jgi:hypothetical protein